MYRLDFRGLRVLAVLALGLMGFMAPARAQDESDDPNPLLFSVTHSGPARYVPGQPVEIVVTITASNDGSLTALGLIDGGPQTWTYAGARPISGDLPAVVPAVGAAGTFEFAWIAMPEVFPYSFAYTLNVPAEATGTATIQGQAQYRTSGGRQLAPPDFITIEGPDNAAPKIRLLGGATVTIQQGQPFQDPGTVATDKEDGDITSKVQVTGNVDTQTPGEYLLTYNVSDSQGQQATAVTRTVVVTASSNNGGNGNNGGNNGGIDGRNRGRVGIGGPGGSDVGPRQRVEELANTGDTGMGDTAEAPASAPGEDLNTQKQRANSLAQELAQQGDPLGRDVAVPATPPTPGPIAKNAGRSTPIPPPGSSTPVNAATTPDDDLAALDSALDAQRDPAAPAPRSAVNTAETATALPSLDPPTAAGTSQAVLAQPEVPGLLERVRARIGALGPREFATIGAFGVALVVLVVIAIVTGRIAYGGQTRRPPQAPKAAA